jgi:hypothetical protein
MFRILLAKVCIASCFIFYSYSIYENEYVMNGFKTRLGHNIDRMSFNDEEIEKHLKELLPIISLLLMVSSILMVFTRSSIPKVLSLIGFVTYSVMNQHPDFRLHMDPEALQ